jgi:hypothetical protein
MMDRQKLQDHITQMSHQERSALLTKLAGWFSPTVEAADGRNAAFWEAVEQLTMVERAADDFMKNPEYFIQEDHSNK